MTECAQVTILLAAGAPIDAKDDDGSPGELAAAGGQAQQEGAGEDVGEDARQAGQKERFKFKTG